MGSLLKSMWTLLSHLSMQPILYPPCLFSKPFLFRNLRSSSLLRLNLAE